MKLQICSVFKQKVWYEWSQLEFQLQPLIEASSFSNDNIESSKRHIFLSTIDLSSS